jgi:uncharacterized protein
MLQFLVVETLVLWLLHVSVATSSVQLVTAGHAPDDVLAWLAWCTACDFALAWLALLPALGLVRLLGRRLAWPLVVVAAALVLTTAYLDARVFLAQGVHVYDPIALRALANPDANRELHLGWRIAAELAGVLLVTAALSAAVAYKSARVATTPRRLVALHLALLVLAAATMVGLRARLFAPGSPLMASLPGARLVFSSSPPPTAYHVTYPGALSPHAMAKRPDILVVVIESLRADAFTPELMPALTRFAKEHGCIVPERHYSSSHATELGIFSLLYGLDASRYPAFARAHTPSALLKVLRDNGYALRGGSASALRSWTDAAFLADQLDGFVEPADKESWRRDAALAAWARALPARSPSFTFLFFDATHLDYSYPPELEIDTPVLRGDFTRYLARNTLAAHKTEVVNRYRNAVRFVDRTLGEILPALGGGAVVVTGDHGEEFWEHELLGHSAPRFWNERIRVPLVLCLPGEAPRPIARSAHADLLPTVLAWAGASAPADGESLLAATRGDVVVTAAGFPRDAGELALIDDRSKIWLAADAAWQDRFRLVRATDLDDRPLPAAPPIDARVAAFVQRFHRFLAP